jgi:TPR repeat protein
MLIGDFFQYGKEGYPEDSKQAFYWYLRSADGGYPHAMYLLGEIYEEGYGHIQSDEATAFNWYKKAAEARLFKEMPTRPASECTHAQIKLGEMYLIGKGIEQSDESASYWFRHFCAQWGKSRGFAQFEVAEIYLKHENIENKLIKEAVYWFEQYANEGNAEANFRLALIYMTDRRTLGELVSGSKPVRAFEGDLTLANFWFKKAANLFQVQAEDPNEYSFSQNEALNRLGSMYFNGYGEKNYKKAVYFIQIALEQDGADGYSLYILGKIFEEGGFGVEKDEKKSKQWYQLSAEKGESRALEALENLKGKSNGILGILKKSFGPL